MIKLLLYTFYFLFLPVIVFGQVKQKSPVKPVVSELKKLLNGNGLPSRMVNDSLAVIPYEGANIASYNVVIQKVSDLYIVYTNLTEALPGKIDASKYKYLLQQNDHFDIVKIGMSGDDDAVYVRADIYKIGTTTALLTRIIKQVANVTNIIGGDLK
ncbi:MAG: hypothetical protein ABIR18_07135 [Chitinophagaceae bacterium]